MEIKSSCLLLFLSRKDTMSITLMRLSLAILLFVTVRQALQAGEAKLEDEVARLDSLYADLDDWIVSVYDPATGGFWESVADKKKGKGRPRLESTCRVLGVIQKMDALDDLPPAVKAKLIQYIQQFQNKYGWFDDPQENRVREMRLGRAMGYATRALEKLGAEPLYPLPTDKGDDPDLKHLKSPESVRAWVEDLAKKHEAWRVGGVINGQRNVIMQLPDKKREMVLNTLFDYFAETQAKDGYWWRGDEYNRLSGAFKISGLYSTTGTPVPNAETIYRTTLKIMREKPAGHGCFVRNPLHLLKAIEPQVTDIMTGKDKADIARITMKNVRNFKTADGGFSMHRGGKVGLSDGVSQAMKARDGARRALSLPEKPFPGKEDLLAGLSEQMQVSERK